MASPQLYNNSLQFNVRVSQPSHLHRSNKILRDNSKWCWFTKPCLLLFYSEDPKSNLWHIAFGRHHIYIFQYSLFKSIRHETMCTQRNFDPVFHKFVLFGQTSRERNCARVVLYTQLRGGPKVTAGVPGCLSRNKDGGQNYAAARRSKSSEFIFQYFPPVSLKGYC